MNIWSSIGWLVCCYIGYDYRLIGSGPRAGKMCMCVCLKESLIEIADLIKIY